MNKKLMNKTTNKILIFFLLSSFLAILSCSTNQTQESMEKKSFTTVNDAIKHIESYKGNAEEFELPISDSLLDPSGINMAIITDKLLQKEFFPNGFEQKDGYRIYRYKSEP